MALYQGLKCLQVTILYPDHPLGIRILLCFLDNRTEFGGLPIHFILCRKLGNSASREVRGRPRAELQGIKEVTGADQDHNFDNLRLPKTSAA